MASAGSPPAWRYSSKLQGYYYIDERGDRPKTVVTSDGRRYPVDGSVPWTMEAAAATSSLNTTRANIDGSSDYRYSPRTARTRSFEVGSSRGQYSRYAAPGPDTLRLGHPDVPRALAGASALAMQYSAVPLGQPDPINTMTGTTRRPHPGNQLRPESLLSNDATEYKVQSHPRSFYIAGKVFMTLWAEPARASSTKADNGGISDSVVMEGPNRGRVFSKVRRFVVIRAGDRSCSALPIVTYTSAKALAPGYLASEHGIIYSGERAPDRAHRLPDLLPQAVKVQLDDPSARLDAQTLVDYSAVHTIDHDLKVKSLGQIDDDSTAALLKQWKDVFIAKVPLAGSSPPRTDEGAVRRQLGGSTGTRQRAGRERSSSHHSDAYDAASLTNSIRDLHLAAVDEEERSDVDSGPSASESESDSDDDNAALEISQSTPNLHSGLAARGDGPESKSTANAVETAITALRRAGYTRQEAVAILGRASHVRKDRKRG